MQGKKHFHVHRQSQQNIALFWQTWQRLEFSLQLLMVLPQDSYGFWEGELDEEVVRISTLHLQLWSCNHHRASPSLPRRASVSPFSYLVMWTMRKLECVLKMRHILLRGNCPKKDDYSLQIWERLEHRSVVCLHPRETHMDSAIQDAGLPSEPVRRPCSIPFYF